MEMKTMKIVSLMLGLAALSLRADVLYWYVDQPQSTGIPFAYASMVSQDGTTLYTTSEGGDSIPADSSGYALAPKYIEGIGMLIGPQSSYIDESFYIELYNSNLDVVGRSCDYAFKDVDYAISSSDTTKPWSPLTVSSFTSVPEPTSGVLLMIGLAGLALKRKHAVLG